MSSSLATLDSFQKGTVGEEPGIPGITILPYQTELDLISELQNEKSELENEIRSRTRFFGLSCTIPRDILRNYHRRIQVITCELIGLQKVVRAYQLGYVPYIIPANWSVGLLNRSDRKTSDPWSSSIFDHRVLIDSVFNAPLPSKALKALLEAKEQDLFCTFVVASTDKTLFERIPASIYLDPVLVGFIRTGAQTSLHTQSGWFGADGYSARLVTTGVKGFLIAQWGIEQELTKL